MSARVIHAKDFVAEAVELIADSARIAIATHGVFRLGLSGGSTPEPVYAELARSASELPWQKVQITFGDERCVPPDDIQSNYRMSRHALLDRVKIPDGNVFRMRGELPPAEAAADYEKRLRTLAERFKQRRYVHDLLLLGLGEDGHTASLFPDTDALNETERDVVENYVPKLKTHRLTFTFPLINAARHVCFLVRGAQKQSLAAEIVAGRLQLPAAQVRPDDGELTWLLSP